MSSAPRRGLRVVSLGGGTGMAALLSGLKRHVAPPAGRRAGSIESLTAVVAVTDDGGSSGRLRDEFSILAPGDIRNCIVALSDHTALLTQLFSFRFRGNGHLGGHSLGNLLLTALASVKGDFLSAIKAAGEVLAIRGTIYPATMQNVHLVADLEDGTSLKGESTIAKATARIETIRLEPSRCKPLPETLAAIRRADVITLGPGSLYTSIIPNLLVPGIAGAIRSSRGLKIFICNVMTQPGETHGFTASDHLRSVERICGPGLADRVLVNTAVPTAAALRKYRRDGAEPVRLDLAGFGDLAPAVRTRKLMSEERPPSRIVRHDPARLARCILSLHRERR